MSQQTATQSPMQRRIAEVLRGQYNPAEYHMADLNVKAGIVRITANPVGTETKEERLDGIRAILVHAKYTVKVTRTGMDVPCLEVTA